MDSFIFGFIIIVLLAAFIFYVQEANKEKAKLINALVSKNPEDFRNLILADKVQQIKTPTQVAPDLVPENQLSQQEWENAIHETLNKQQEEDAGEAQ